MGLDDRRQATGQDSDECPETITFSPRLRLSDLASVFIPKQHEYNCKRLNE